MLVARDGLSPLMVGRDREVDELRRRFATVPGSETPPVVIVSGEAGVGKTRLLREFSGHVIAQGGAVLAGRADETTLAPPFEVLRDLVQPAVVEWDALPESLELRAHALGHILSPLLPGPQDTHDHKHTVDELVRAAVDLIVHVVGDTPTLLAFEDLHWGDAESIALFARLAATRRLPVLLVGTFRPEDFDRRHPLASVLPALERRHTVTHLSLGRLDDRAMARLLEVVFGRPVPTAIVTTVQRRTQGNPFFVEELIAGSSREEPGDLVTAALPWNAAEAVLRRVDDLDPDTRRLLDTASLLGTRISFDLLRAVTALGEDDLIERLRTLVDRGLVVETDVDVFRFRHALTREAVAGQLLGREQRRVHEAALRTLEAQGTDDMAALARHAAGAREWGKLVTYAREGSARNLRDGAGLQALQLAELGLSLADELDIDDELALRATAARAAWQISATDAAGDHTDQWIRFAADAGRTASEAAAWRQRSLLWLHTDERYIEAVERARTIAEQLGPSEELAWCYAYTSQAHMVVDVHLAADEGDATLEWADRAIAMADEAGAPQVRPWALVNKGTVLNRRLGHEEAGLAVLGEAESQALALGDYTTAMRAMHNALNYLVHGRGNADLERAQQLLDRADRLADRYGMELFAAEYAGFRAHVESLRGDLAASEEALRRSTVFEDAEGIAQAATRAILLTERDRVEEATGVLDAVEPFAQRLLGLPYGSWWTVGRMTVAAHRGDRRAVEAAVADLVNFKIELDFNQTVVAEAYVLAAGGSVALEVLEPLLGADRRLEVTGRAPADFNPAWFEHARAIRSERSGDPEAAAEGYGRALSHEIRRPAWAVADAEQGLARCTAALGRRAEAAAYAASAVARLERWPGWRRRAAEALYRRLAGPKGDGPAGLTPREREVLALLAEGCSNREIAERLFIAAKTVAVHVSNILGKTGTSSRTAAAAWAQRSGVLEQTSTADQP